MANFLTFLLTEKVGQKEVVHMFLTLLFCLMLFQTLPLILTSNLYTFTLLSEFFCPYKQVAVIKQKEWPGQLLHAEYSSDQ